MNLLTLVPRVCGSVCCSRRHTSAVHLALRRAAYPPSRASQTRSRQTNAVESVHRGVIISKAECTVRRFCRRKSTQASTDEDGRALDPNKLAGTHTYVDLDPESRLCFSDRPFFGL